MKMFSQLSLTVAIIALAVAPAVSRADTFDITGSFAGGITLTGVVSGNMFAPGKYDLESGTITVAGGTTIGTGTLDPDLNGPGALYTYQNPPNSGGANYTIDNILTPASNPALTDNGFLATINNIPVNIWADGANNYELFAGNYLEDVHGTLNFTDVTAAAAPEPSSLLLLGTGFASAAGMFFRRSKSLAS